MERSDTLTLGILAHFRHFRHFSLRHFSSSQSGMAYMAILVLLAILSTLTFSFIFKTGSLSSATMTRGSGMQAHYLAETAANHAMWRLLNESVQTITLQVAHGDDDADEKDDGTVDRGRKHLELGKHKYVGVRFLNVTIPQSATIINASMEFMAHDTDSDHTDMTIFGQDTDDTARFQGNHHDISNRARTSASVTWHDIPPWTKGQRYWSPDLGSMVKEIVDRSGWTSGNAMVILFRSDDLSGHRRICSYNDQPVKAPILHVMYSDGPAMAENVYYMHSLAGGRYGYKVRWHTDTTFATIATVGAMGDNVVNQSYVLHIIPEQEDVIDVLFVVKNPYFPTGQEQLRKSLMEEWGYMVTLIDESDSQGDYDDALANADVAYVSEEINANEVNTKLTDASIGVVNEEIYLTDELKFTSGNMLSRTRDQIKIVDNTHYITLPFSTGWLTFLDSSEDVSLLNSPYAPGMRVLAKTLNLEIATATGPSASESINKPSLATLEFGADLYSSGTAAGRRVHLPWGAGSFDFAELNADGQNIMRRAIEWGAEPSLVANMKRRPIEISNTGNALVDYPLLVTLTTDIMGSPYSHVNSDGSDVRFSDGAGTLFNYWIESWDHTGTSKIWVNVPSIPAGTSTIYLHYGNGTMRSAGNGLATFLFFDDFEDHSAGEFADGWLPADTYKVQDDGGLKVLDDDVSGSGRNVTAQHASWDDVAVRQRFRSVDGAVNHAGVVVRWADDSNEVYGGIVSNTTAQIWDRIGGGWSQRGGTWNIPNVGTTWHVQELRVAGTTAELYIDDTHIGNGTLRVGIPSTGTSGFWSQYNQWGYRDWHLVRKYASPEPSTSVGDQE